MLSTRVNCIVGIGGGMDFCGGLFLFFKNKLKKEKNVIVNLTFVGKSTLDNACKTLGTKQIYPWIYLVIPQPPKIMSKYISPDDYFPEQRLASYLNHPIYIILPYDTYNTDISRKNDPTIGHFAKFFCEFLEKEKVTHLFYVDGGCDSIMKGNELGLGTPTEDFFTIRVFEEAVTMLLTKKLQKQRQKIQRQLVVVGLDLDTAHGVKLEDLNARLETLEPISKTTLDIKDVYVQQYCDAILSCNAYQSIVHSLVIGRIKGYKDYEVPPWLRPRLNDTLVPLTPRLAELFIFSIDDVTNSNIYYKGIKSSFTCDTLDKYIIDKHERAYFRKVLTDLHLTKKVLVLCWEYLDCILF